MGYVSDEIINIATDEGLRTESDVVYCVHSTWFSRSFNNYFDAVKFVEKLKMKYKRISYLSISTSKILIDLMTKRDIEKY